MYKERPSCSYRSNLRVCSCQSQFACELVICISGPFGDLAYLHCRSLRHAVEQTHVKINIISIIIFYFSKPIWLPASHKVLLEIIFLLEHSSIVAWLSFGKIPFAD